MKSRITVEHFLEGGFLEAKMNLCIAVIESLKDLNHKLSLQNKPRKSRSKSKSRLLAPTEASISKDVTKEPGTVPLAFIKLNFII